MARRINAQVTRLATEKAALRNSVDDPQEFLMREYTRAKNFNDFKKRAREGLKVAQRLTN